MPWLALVAALICHADGGTKPPPLVLLVDAGAPAPEPPDDPRLLDDLELLRQYELLKVYPLVAPDD
jgi:hypothetical protein